MSTNNPMSNIPPLGPPTGMMPGTGSSKFKPVDPMRVLRGNWGWLVTALVLGCFMGGGVWFLLNKYVAKYQSEAQFSIEVAALELNSGTARFNDIEPYILNEVAAITNEPTLRAVLNYGSVVGAAATEDSPEIPPTQWFTQFNGNKDLALQDLQESVINANHLRGTTLFMVSAETASEEDAAVILSALTEEYTRLKREQENNRSSQLRGAAESRRDEAEETLADARVARNTFLEQNSVTTTRDNFDTATYRVRSITETIEELTNDRNALQAQLNFLEEREEAGDFEPSDQERQQIENSNIIINLDAQVRALRSQLNGYLLRYGEDHPLVRETESQIALLEQERQRVFDEQARNLFRGTLEGVRNTVDSLNQQIAALNEDLPDWERRREDFQRALQSYTTGLEALTRAEELAEDELATAQQAVADLREADETNAYVEVTPTFSPTKATQSFPPDKELLIPGGGVVMLILATGLVFLREVMDQRVRSAADVKMIPDAALVGLVPDADEDPAGGKTVELVVEERPAGLLAEAFRQVRTAVLSKIDRRGYKTLMLVSAKPGAGVTAVAQNLAASCALSGRRVLIIDANFRRPALAGLMGLPGEPGLADVLSGSKSMDELMSLTQTSSTTGLSLLPAGDSSAAAVELFENPRFREVMARLETEFDLVIIDAPPALLTSDAQLLSRHVDAMVLVSRAKTDTRGMLQRLYRELDGQRADILGVVLNGVQHAAGGYLKRNFQEFTEYAGPERRKTPRVAKPVGAAPVTAGAVPSDGPATIGMDDDEMDEADDSGFDFDSDDDQQR